MPQDSDTSDKEESSSSSSKSSTNSPPASPAGSSKSSASSKSSKSSDAPQPQQHQSKRIHLEDDEEDDDAEENEDVAMEISQESPSSSSSPRPPVPPPPVRHECDMPSTCPNLGSKLFYVKLPNFLSIDTREYDPLYYEDEIDEDEQLDNEGRARMKLKVENTIRWRKIKNAEGKEETQSNARVVEWSDGTMSLYLGGEIFDVNEKSIGECSHLFVRQGLRQGLQGQAIFNSKLSIRPNSTESFTHRKLTLSLADRSQKTQKIRMLNNPGQDPEARLSELSKKEDDKMKATLRRETKQRRIQERSQVRGPNASYLEPDYDEEDEDGAISLSAIKRGAMARPYANDSDSSEGDDQDYSDDSDPEFGKVKRKSDRKAKQVVDDSDDE